MLRHSVATALLLFSLCARGAGWDTTISVPAALPADFSPAAMTLPDTDGYWALQAGATPAIVRFGTNGVPQVVRYPPFKGVPSAVSIMAMKDGGLVVFDVEGTCTLRRYDNTGKLRWTNAIPALPLCVPTVSDGGGNLWLQNKDLYEVGVDGAFITHYGPGYADNFLFGWPFGAGVLVLGPVVVTPDDVLARLWFRSPSLNRSFVNIFQHGTSFSHIATVDAAHFYAVGLAADPPLDPTTHSLFANSFALNAFGDSYVSAWTHDFTGIIADAVTAVTPAAPFDLYVTVSQPGTATSPAGSQLLRISDVGTISWTRPVDGTVRSGADGDAVVVGKTVTRFDASGKQLFSHPLPAGTSIVDHQVLADGSSLAIIRANSGTLATQFLHTSASGATLPPPKTAGILQTDRAIAASAAADGSWFALSTNDAGKQYALVHTRADGSMLWQIGGTGHWDDTTNLVPIGDSVCIVGPLDAAEVVACRHAADGQAAAQSTLATLTGAPAPGGRAMAVGSDRVVLVYHDGAQWHHALVGMQGNVLHDTVPFDATTTPRDIAFDVAGATLIGAGANYGRLSAEGTWLYKRALDPQVGTTTQVVGAADGSGVFFSSRIGADATLSHIDAQGNIVWTKVLPFFLAPGAKAATGATIDGDALIFATDRSLTPATIYDIALADGSQRWTTPTSIATGGIDGIIIDGARHRVLQVGAVANKIHMLLVDAGSGAVLDERNDACAADTCAITNLEIDADSVLRAVASTRGNSSGSVLRVFSRTQVLVAPTAVRLDQTGLDGAWYAPYSSGQGFVIDYLGGPGTLFMPWFTFAPFGAVPNGTNDLAALGWYTLQGNVTAGATELDVGIYRTAPGAFNTGTVATHQVGTAHLDFSDCSNGSLHYQFTGGSSGTISLSRLSPATTDCLLADGSTAHATVPAPQQGFDARQSGSWYDPATSGQGVELAVVPASNGSPGLIFGAWFTFDIADKSDDANHQHWFTLQGDLSSANNGLVTLPIFRTLGGTFDADPTGNILPVGYANLVMHGCDSALLVYQFDNADVAHQYAGLRGQLNLTKALGCSAP